MDSHVGKHILDEVLSSRTGLLHNKTRILVTNSLFCLPDVDFIVVLKNGKITDYGTYEELMAQKGVFAELITQYTTNESVINEDTGSSDDSIDIFRNRVSTIEEPKAMTDKSKLVEKEMAETGVVKFAVIFQMFITFNIFM